MAGNRPRWASADVPVALLVLLVLVLAFVLPGVLSDDDPAPSGQGPRPTVGPAPTPDPQDVVPAPTLVPRPGDPAATGGPGGARVPRSATGEACVDLPAPRLSVVSFNMRSGLNGSRTRTVLDQAIQEIARFDADVVLLQEVDRNRNWSGRIDQPARIAEQLKMYYAFGTNVLRSGNRAYGTAVLSRYPIQDAENTLLPNRPGMQQRGLLRVRLTPYGIPITVYNTHLENTSADMRVEQARAIARIVAADPLPKVVGGDLNAGPGSAVLAALSGQLTDSWPVVGVGAGLTHPSSAPRSRIDYLLHAGGTEPVEADVIPSAASDHNAVRVVYELPTQSDEVCLPDLG